MKDPVVAESGSFFLPLSGCDYLNRSERMKQGRPDRERPVGDRLRHLVHEDGRAVRAIARELDDGQ